MKGAVRPRRGAAVAGERAPDPELVLHQRDGRLTCCTGSEIVLEEPRRRQDQEVAARQHPPLRPAHDGADRVGAGEQPVDVEAFVDQPRPARTPAARIRRPAAACRVARDPDVPPSRISRRRQSRHGPHKPQQAAAVAIVAGRAEREVRASRDRPRPAMLSRRNETEATVAERAQAVDPTQLRRLGDVEGERRRPGPCTCPANGPHRASDEREVTRSGASQFGAVGPVASRRKRRPDRRGGEVTTIRGVRAVAGGGARLATGNPRRIGAIRPVSCRLRMGRAG
jgi:hypothetical protein